MSAFRLIKIVLFLFGIILLIGCLQKNNPAANPPNPTTSLDGYWDNGEIIIHIENAEGRFYEIRQGEWMLAYDQGFVDIGTLKFRYISHLKADEFFQGQELWLRYENLIVKEVNWSDYGEFNLRSEGNKLYVNTINPWGTNWSTVEYTRVYP